MHPFRAAVESMDVERISATLAEDVVFRSPVVHRPYEGRDAVTFVLAGVVQVFEGFRYEREIGAPGDADHALVFLARVGDRDVHGVDLVHTNADGLVDELTVMLRPLSAAHAVRDAMAAALAAATESA